VGVSSSGYSIALPARGAGGLERDSPFRLAVASVFIKARLTKIASWEVTVELFRHEHEVLVLPPETAAAQAATFERGCSTLLVLGRTMACTRGCPPRR
jgi:hypothetical protein